MPNEAASAALHAPGLSLPTVRRPPRSARPRARHQRPASPVLGPALLPQSARATKGCGCPECHDTLALLIGQAVDRLAVDCQPGQETQAGTSEVGGWALSSPWWMRAAACGVWSGGHWSGLETVDSEQWTLCKTSGLHDISNRHETQHPPPRTLPSTGTIAAQQYQNPGFIGVALM